MSNFYQKALDDFGGQFASLIQPANIDSNYVTAQVGKQLIRKRNTYKVVPQNKDLQTVPPSSTVPAALLNGGTIQFRVDNVADVIDFFTLRIDILNDTGAAVVLAPTPHLISRIDISSGNGSTLITSIYGEELFITLGAMLPRNEWENMCAGMGFTTAYASAATSIANGGTATLYLPILQPFISTKIHPGALASPMLFQIYFNPTAQTHASGTLVNCTNCVLQVNSRDQLNALASEQRNFYKGSIPLMLTFTNIQRINQSMTLAPGNTYSVLLSGINGIVTSLFFGIRPAVITGANCLTYYPVQDFDVLDNNNASLIGFTRRTPTEDLWQYAQCYDNLFKKNVSFNSVTFSSNPVQDYVSGSIFGYEPFNSFQRLSFSLPASFTAGTYTLSVIALVADNLIIRDGIMQSQKI